MRTVTLTLDENDMFRVYNALRYRIDQLQTRAESEELRALDQSLAVVYTATLDKVADAYRGIAAGV